MKGKVTSSWLCLLWLSWLVSRVVKLFSEECWNSYSWGANCIKDADVTFIDIILNFPFCQTLFKAKKGKRIRRHKQEMNCHISIEKVSFSGFSHLTKYSLSFSLKISNLMTKYDENRITQEFFSNNVLDDEHLWLLKPEKCEMILWCDTKPENC